MFSQTPSEYNNKIIRDEKIAKKFFALYDSCTDLHKTADLFFGDVFGTHPGNLVMLTGGVAFGLLATLSQLVQGNPLFYPGGLMTKQFAKEDCYTSYPHHGVPSPFFIFTDVFSGVRTCHTEYKTVNAPNYFASMLWLPLSACIVGLALRVLSNSLIDVKNAMCHFTTILNSLTKEEKRIIFDDQNHPSLTLRKIKEELANINIQSINAYESMKKINHITASIRDRLKEQDRFGYFSNTLTADIIEARRTTGMYVKIAETPRQSCH